MATKDLLSSFRAGSARNLLVQHRSAGREGASPNLGSRNQCLAPLADARGSDGIYTRYENALVEYISYFIGELFFGRLVVGFGEGPQLFQQAPLLPVRRR